MIKSPVEAVRQASILIEQGNYAEAEKIIERMLAKNPGDGLALNQLGSIYSYCGRNGLAIPYLSMAAILLKKSDPEARVLALHNLSVALRQEGHYEAAQEAAREAVGLIPESPEAWNNMAANCVNDGRPEEGEGYARKSLALEDMPEAGNNLALCLLEQGKWEEAWDKYEYRFGTQEYIKNKRSYAFPQWNGEETGTLILHGEQGLGDEILFLSMALEAKKLCKRLVVEANGRLRQLLRRSLDCEIVSNPDEAMDLTEGKIDAICPMGSLGRFFRRNEKSFAKQKPYLKPDPLRVEYWSQRLREIGKGPYIALAWKGGTQRTHEDLRNPPIELFADLINSVPDATFVSVQYTKDAALQAKLWGISHWQEAINDLDEQAALIAACDMTISVAQTALHISGGIGCKTIGLIGSKPAWRYQLRGERMLWYPSVRLLRQDGMDWKPTIHSLIKELTDQRQLRVAAE